MCDCNFPETQTLGEYHKQRNKAITNFLANLPSDVTFTWHRLEYSIDDYQHFHKISIVTPYTSTRMPDGSIHCEGGWPFKMYKRINRALNTLVDKKILTYEVIKNVRHYKRSQP
jgi:hypothetical protein